MEAQELTKAQQYQEEVDKAWQQFLFIIWTPNPREDKVRIILDDGRIKLTMKQDKFFNLISDVLTEDGYDQNTIKALSYIQTTLNQYSGWFFLDRDKMDFRELSQVEVEQKLMPCQIIKDAQKELQNEAEDSIVTTSLHDVIFSQNVNKEEKKKHDKFNTIYRVFSTGNLFRRRK